MSWINPTALFSFWVLNLGFALIPGPDMLCVLSHALRGGRRAALRACAGLATGCLLHIALAGAGLSALLLAAPAAFRCLRVAGAGYLVWLGVRLWLAPPAAPVPGAGPGRRPFVQGMLSNALNPKVALCFVAVLPQFIDPARGHVAWQAGLLGAMALGAGLVVNCSVAWAGARLRGNALPGVAHWAPRMVGVLLLTCAGRLALA